MRIAKRIEERAGLLRFPFSVCFAVSTRKMIEANTQQLFRVFVGNVSWVVEKTHRMKVSIAISDSRHDMRHFVWNALRKSGMDVSSPSAADWHGRATAAVVFGLQGADEFLARVDCASALSGPTQHLIMFERGGGLMRPQARLRKRQLELQIQTAALASAPVLAVNAIILEDDAADILLESDIAATVLFIVSTSAMTGQVFLLG